MKKVIIILAVLVLSVSSVFAFTFDLSRFSVGLAMGTSRMSEKTFSNANAVSAESGKFGFLVLIRADYKFDAANAATLMVTYDSPSKSVLMNNLRTANDMASKYIKIFVGYSRDTVTEKFVISYGVGPEMLIDLSLGRVGVAGTAYTRTSYMLPDTSVSLDATVRGSVQGIADNANDSDWHLYLDGDAAIGLTYRF